MRVYEERMHDARAFVFGGFSICNLTAYTVLVCEREDINW